MPTSFPTVRPRLFYFVVTAGLCLLLLCLNSIPRLSVAAAGTVGSHVTATVRAQANGDIGANDPLGAPTNYTMFADDELWLPYILGDVGSSGALDLQTALPNTSLVITGTVDLGQDFPDYTRPAPQIYAARGRVTNQNYDQVVYARVAGGNIELLINDRNTVPTNSATLLNLAPRATGFADFMEVAVGDLDKLADSAGNNHDEVAVVWASANGSGYTVNVQVMDYTDPNTDTTKQPVGSAATTTALGIDSLDNITPNDNIVGLAIGDFDGDMYNELAVVHLQNANTLVITTFRYSNDGQGNRAVTLANTTTTTPFHILGSGTFNGSLAAASGDVDGDSIAELIVGVSENLNTNNMIAGMALFKGSSNLDLQVWQTQIAGDTGNTPARVQVSSGMLKYDPDNGYNFGTSQWLFGSGSEATVWVAPYGYNQTSQTVEQLGAGGGFFAYSDQRWSIAAGGYRGILDTENPAWSSAFYGVDTASNAPIVCLFELTFPCTAQPTLTYPVYLYDAGTRVPVIAYDYDGDSLYLGAPIHIAADNMLSTDYIIYEPPKHAFYNIDQSGKWGAYGQIVNLSRYPDFNVTFTQNNTASVNSSSTNNSNWSIGGSAALSASDTIGASMNLEETKISASIGYSVTVGAGYSYNKSKQTTDSQYSSNTITYATTTSADDTIGGNYQNLDIWRYRLYGAPASILNNNPSGYYDYVIPQPQTNFSKMGLAFDSYAPLHENGNLLSYPLAIGNTFTPSDIGTFVVNGKTFTETLIPVQDISCCGNAGSTALNFSASVSNGSTVTTNKTLTENADVTTSVSGIVKENEVVAQEQVSTQFGAAITFNNSNSWGNVSTAQTTTTLGQAITLNYPADATGSYYDLFPVMYYAQDGTLKIAHAVQFPPASVSGFWNGYYGQKSDPALNLPHRFYETTFSNNPAWLPTLDDSRKTIRGFALLDGTPNPVTGENDILPDAPVASEPLLIQANVYNYSLGGITNNVPTSANNLVVQFEYAPFDGTNETGPRVLIGTTTIAQLSPLQMQSVQIPWDTTDLGGSAPCATQDYRIIVTLDPSNTIDEIYESENPDATYPLVTVDPFSEIPTNQNLQGINPGQNNEGYGYATIQTPNATNDCNTGFNADVSLKSTSLAAFDPIAKKPLTDKPRVFLQRAARVRLQVYSNKRHGLFGHVLIYDGRPGKGGKLIADKIVHTGNPKGATVWFDWVPETKGKHILYARYLSRRADPNKKNHRDILRVDVIDVVKRREQ